MCNQVCCACVWVYLHKDESVCQSADLSMSFTPSYTPPHPIPLSFSLSLSLKGEMCSEEGEVKPGLDKKEKLEKMKGKKNTRTGKSGVHVLNWPL